MSAHVAIAADGEQAYVTLPVPKSESTVIFTYDLIEVSLASVEICRREPHATSARAWLSELSTSGFGRLEDVARRALLDRLDGTEYLTSEELVQLRFSELSGEISGNALRRRNSLLFLAEAAREYAALEREGHDSPTQALAATHGVANETVRGWLHRARREGLTPASSHPNTITRQEGRPS